MRPDRSDRANLPFVDETATGIVDTAPLPLGHSEGVSDCNDPVFRKTAALDPTYTARGLKIAKGEASSAFPSTTITIFARSERTPSKPAPTITVSIDITIIAPAKEDDLVRCPAPDWTTIPDNQQSTGGDPEPSLAVPGPATIVVGNPAPGFVRDPCPAIGPIPAPVAKPVGRPAVTNSTWRPDPSILRSFHPLPITIKIPVTRYSGRNIPLAPARRDLLEFFIAPVVPAIPVIEFIDPGDIKKSGSTPLNPEASPFTNGESPHFRLKDLGLPTDDQ